MSIVKKQFYIDQETEEQLQKYLAENPQLKKLWLFSEIVRLGIQQLQQQKVLTATNPKKRGK